MASPPLSNGTTPYDRSPSGSTPMTSKVTRTVAIIKNHALDHRFDIERRIQEASFEIVKERQMEFDTETDPEYMYELFGDDVDSLAEGPVWVYVLERRRAVEVWNTLMGHRDPQTARQESPTSLRGLYGISIEQNGFMGSPDVQTAETQITSLFASSPPFPATDLPDESRFSTLQSVNSSVLLALKKATASDDGIGSGGASNGRLTANGKPGFKARALPSTHLKPDIVPRTTKAAALRAAGPIVKNGITAITKPREVVSKDKQVATFLNVPGHKRASTISVASTAAPTIAPRMTRAASLRTGQPIATSPIKKVAPTKSDKNTFDGVPGHKRRDTIAVASVQAPTVAPRTNKSAALRAAKDQAPPSSFMFRTPSQAKTPGLSRSNSAASLNGRPATSRPTSQLSARPAPAPLQSNGKGNVTNSNGSGEDPAPRLKTRPSSIGAPTIAPRTNKSAALRLAKKAEEEAAAAAAAARKYGRPKPRPTTSLEA